MDYKKSSLIIISFEILFQSKIFYPGIFMSLKSCPSRLKIAYNYLFTLYYLHEF